MNPFSSPGRVAAEVKPRVLIVDDEPAIRELLVMTLRRMNIDCLEAETLEQALARLQAASSKNAEPIHLCLTDMRLPDGSGMEVIRFIQQSCPGVPVAMITAHGNMEMAIEALKAGAFDFLNKPIELPVLRTLVTSALRLQEPVLPAQGPQLLGVSQAMEQLRRTAGKLARSQAPVYLSGESGTGKERVARLIHHLGPRADQPFIAVNCGAIPADLVESELFGHRKGSFTGATQNKAGLFQAAQGGTLFLDEVADLPLEMQVKLLRAIQEKAVRPVGAQQEEAVDVRILSASHQDLAEQVQRGRFREDLFYRIHVIQLHLPPLRERTDDIPILTDHFITKLCAEMQIPPLSLTTAARQALATWPYPGNVRELENILERALTLCEGSVLDVGDLYLQRSVKTATPASMAQAFDFEQVQALGLEAYLEALECEILREGLKRAEQNKTAAARLLGISFRTLRYRLKKLGLEN